MDHIPVHHENEIAQSEALIGKPAVRFWLHGEFLLVDNGKMSKSLGNTYTVSDLKDRGYDPLAFRYMCLNANYRSKLNFTWDGLNASQVAMERLLEAVLAHKNADPGVKIPAEIIEGFENEFIDAINDDLNIPKALAVAWNVARYGTKSQDLYRLLLKMDQVFALDFDKAAEKVKEKEEAPELDPEIMALIEQRQQARKEKNWKVADEIRDKLNQMGILLEDTPQGVRWSWKK